MGGNSVDQGKDAAAKRRKACALPETKTFWMKERMGPAPGRQKAKMRKEERGGGRGKR